MSLHQIFHKASLHNSQPKRIHLQTKIVLLVTAILIVTGAISLIIVHDNTTGNENILTSLSRRLFPVGNGQNGRFQHHRYQRSFSACENDS